MKGLVLDAKFDPRPDYKLSEFEKTTGKIVTGNAVWRYPKLEVREMAQPAIKANEALIKVKACGVCGSDMHFYETDKDNYILYPGLTKFPAALGHEFSGQVVEIGKGVTDLKVGDMVTAEEMVWCGHCIPCRNGYPNQCQNLEEIGFTIDGAFAEYIAVDAKLCWKLNAIADRYGNEDKAYEAGALVEPTSVAYNGIFERAGGFRPGAYVVVFGCGPIGLGSIALCKAGGAAKVIAFDVSANRRDLAKVVGADYVFDPREGAAHEKILELTEGEGADFHVEAAGAPTLTIPEMEQALAINSKIVQIGRAATRVPLYLDNFQVRHTQLFGAQGHSGNATFPNVIRLMASGLIDQTRIVTARYNLPNAVDAIAKSTARTDGKILVKM
jgi:scyllo-inosose 3-dehydrogenase